MKKVKNRGGEESRISYFVLMVMELGVRETISEELIELCQNAKASITTPEQEDLR